MLDNIDIWFDTVDLGKAVRQKLWLLIDEHIEDVLDEFYDALLSSDHKQQLAGVDMAALRSRQKDHWRRIVLDGVDDEYDQRLRKMHRQHAKIGLDNRQYVTAYLFFLNRFEAAILRGSPGPNDAFRLISALQVIIADDIARALEACYQPTGTA